MNFVRVWVTGGLLALLVGCSGTSGTSNGGSGEGGAFGGGLNSGGGLSTGGSLNVGGAGGTLELTCSVDNAECDAALGPECLCVGCDGATCEEVDCVCPQCAGDIEICADEFCNDDGICEPLNEKCDCSDCAIHPECP